MTIFILFYAGNLAFEELYNGQGLFIDYVLYKTTT